MQAIIYKWFFTCLIIESVPIFRKQLEQLVLYIYILLESGVSKNMLIPTKCKTFLKCLFFFFKLRCTGILIKFWNICIALICLRLKMQKSVANVYKIHGKSSLNERCKHHLSTKVNNLCRICLFAKIYSNEFPVLHPDLRWLQQCECLQRGTCWVLFLCNKKNK